jgi:uncharacterized protein with von Willebrand factor type A (vWA) domain
MADDEEFATAELPEEDWLGSMAGPTGTSSGLVVEGGDTYIEPPSPYGVKLDTWGKRRGEEISKQKEFLPLNLKPEDAADLFGMSFEMEPELTENCDNQNKKEFLQALNENPDYHALHSDTNLDVLASELASLKFGTEYTTFVKEREKQQKQKGKGQDGPPSAKEQLANEMQAMGAANKAVQQAAADVQDLKDMQEAMGIGKDDGQGGKVNSADLKKQFLKLKNDHDLKRICELAGKYRMVARSKQRQKVTHGSDDMVGIVMGGDIEHLLASELAMLGNPLFKLDAQRRLIEKQMMCRDYRAIEHVAKGPIIIVIDESGSMGGERIQNAKAMALAMAWVAKHQGRWCGMVGFSSRNQLRTIALPPRNWPTGEILDWLSKFLNGGTHLPIEKMPEIYTQLGAVKGKTDIVIITDGEAEQPGVNELQAFSRWKQEVQAKVIGISIADESRALKSISEEYFRISSLNVNDEAVGKALSV